MLQPMFRKTAWICSSNDHVFVKTEIFYDFPQHFKFLVMIQVLFSGTQFVIEYAYEQWDIVHTGFGYCINMN